MQVGYVASTVASALPPGALADTVGADAARLAVALNMMVGHQLSESSELVMRIAVEVAGFNVCRRWHHDNYHARFTVTYGEQPGTVFAEAAGVDWFAMNSANKDERTGRPFENAYIVKDPADVTAAPPGAIALIRGRHWCGLPPHPRAAPRRLQLSASRARRAPCTPRFASVADVHPYEVEPAFTATAAALLPQAWQQRDGGGAQVAVHRAGRWRAATQSDPQG